uniref:Uncharacterized protein n=1 Tax=Candidatus Kentrum sp. TUN TaxID=2126343 RepID=A0A451A9Q8_9GAMM|nr:MAG: hypothetical protein BECKTUN1418F_GA0071002_10885 [Candidatus Kentron sp. TUN]VFK59039.1 MAG: hypothetical protein BECKTUN1418D_GA0071000_109413 [Candidatus Kentron sp. TUN]VFK62763.1 MAG: hypothetical protein BECKTUN1418E_GA0071001_10866 [Candidatus Kentron sp. TUN]
MTDEILRELWRIKDRIAEENNYSLDTLVSTLRSKSGDTLFRNDETEPVEQVVKTIPKTVAGSHAPVWEPHCHQRDRIARKRR